MIVNAQLKEYNSQEESIGNHCSKETWNMLHKVHKSKGRTLRCIVYV
jgi:hypothetical protein